MIDDALIRSMKSFAGVEYEFKSLVGSSGGIFVACNSLYWKQLDVFVGEFSVLVLLNMRLNVQWVLTT